MRLQLLLVLLVSGCATAESFGGSTSGLTAKERGSLAAIPSKSDGGFQRFWRRPKTPTPGLIKWSEDRSRTTKDAPGGLLEAIRDEVGRLNQVQRAGGEVLVAVVVYRYQRGWFAGTVVSYEVLGRAPAGELLWAGVDSVRPGADMALSLSDSEEVIVAREVARRLRKELGL